MHEEDEVWLPEFELLHASNGEEALSIIQAGKESNCPIAVAYDMESTSESLSRTRRSNRSPFP